MASITIIGPGAVGSALAAHLSTVSGHDVTVAARTPFDRIELITYDTVLHATPRIVTDPADLSPADWVLVTTKTYDAAATAGWFASGVNS